ncbi:MAG: hypothetical protein AAF688_10700, partial [Bacteroidota bacterium]
LQEKLKQTEKRLEEVESKLTVSERRYEQLFNNLEHEVQLWQLNEDESGNIQNWTLLDVNDASLNSWAKSKLEVIGKTAHQIYG